VCGCVGVVIEYFDEVDDGIRLYIMFMSCMCGVERSLFESVSGARYL
jgi:hypothetical protein